MDGLAYGHTDELTDSPCVLHSGPQPCYLTTFTIENAPPDIWYGRMVERIVRMKESIHQSLQQLLITSMTARFHFGTNGIGLFEDSYLEWCQIVSDIFFGALA